MYIPLIAIFTHIFESYILLLLCVSNSCVLSFFINFKTKQNK